MASIDPAPGPAATLIETGDAATTRTETAGLDAELVADLHDAFGMMYAGSEWDSDDEVSPATRNWNQPTAERRPEEDNRRR